jgi:succinate dehydrogenase/fumarate reductase flavoprotein subunit
VPEPTGGSRVWHLLKRAIMKREIKTAMSTPVVEVVKDDTGRAIGVLALHEGRQVYYKARKGVVLTLGGFEYNDELKRQYLTPPTIGGLGNPSNTGDGIKIALKAGADLWHMAAEASTLGFRPPDYEAGFALTIRQPGFIYLDSQGNRYLDETRLEAHNAGVETAAFDLKTYSYLRTPSWVIMDGENAHGPALGMDIFSYNVVVKKYKWSKDNSEEIKAGWIKQAMNVDELARITRISANTLLDTLLRYNASCRQGVDGEYGRSSDTLKPLEPPYYAMQLHPLMYNTQGGPRRDQHARVLDPDGKFIPGLYAAGEFGSIWGFRYQTSTNFSEALIYGRVAGRNAAAEPGLASEKGENA